MRSAQAYVQKLDGDRYRVFVEAPRDPVTGKRKRLTRTVRGSRKAAERVKTELLVAVGETREARESMTLDDFFQNVYLPDAKKRLRPNTVYGYERHYAADLRATLGGYHMAEISPVLINAWLNTIDGAAKRFEAYKMLRQILSKAVKLDLLDSNPCARVDAPRKPSYRPQPLSSQDAVTYLNHFRGHRLEAVMLVVIGGALRRSEVAALDWRDIAEDGAVTIDDAVTVVGGKPHRDATKTRFSERVVHLPPSIAQRLNELRGDGAEPVAQERDGSRMNPDRISRLYREHLKALPEGVPRIPLKDLRHTSLSLLIESGTDLLAVSRRAGHSSVDITAHYYLRPKEVIDIAAANSLEQYLGSSNG